MRSPHFLHLCFSKFAIAICLDSGYAVLTTNDQNRWWAATRGNRQSEVEHVYPDGSQNVVEAHIRLSLLLWTMSHISSLDACQRANERKKKSEPAIVHILEYGSPSFFTRSTPTSGSSKEYLHLFHGELARHWGQSSCICRLVSCPRHCSSLISVGSARGEKSQATRYGAPLQLRLVDPGSVEFCDMIYHRTI